MTTHQSRDKFLVEDLFQPGVISTVYIDRCGMGGENQEFTDMDAVAISGLR
jgi:5-keto 4-deoxyuronate isomerase